MEVDGIKMQEKKVLGVLEQPRPKTVKDVQKFLGLANYYRQFVKDFARIAKLLYRNFWWPEMTKEVKKYIEEYNTYQKNKA